MITFRQARPEDCEAIAGHVLQLARHIGVSFTPKVTADELRRHGFGENPLLFLWVAQSEEAIMGSAVANLMYSTWRGEPGIYIIDLFVDPQSRGLRIGEKLLRDLARQAWAKGARYIRLDVDNNNHGAARFYERAGFHAHLDDRYFALDEPAMKSFISDS